MTNLVTFNAFQNEQKHSAISALSQQLRDYSPTGASAAYPFSQPALCIQGQRELGIPAVLLRLASAICQHQKPFDRGALATLLSEIPSGADLSGIAEKFILWMIGTGSWSTDKNRQEALRIIERAVESGDHSRLLEAVELADLEESECNPACLAIYSLARAAYHMPFASGKSIVNAHHSSIAESAYFMGDFFAWSEACGVKPNDGLAMLRSLIQSIQSDPIRSKVAQ